MSPKFKRILMMPWLKKKWANKINSLPMRSAQEIYNKRVELTDKFLEAERQTNKPRMEELKTKLEVLNWVING
jgi:hypothetical protein